MIFFFKFEDYFIISEKQQHIMTFFIQYAVITSWRLIQNFNNKKMMGHKI